MSIRWSGGKFVPLCIRCDERPMSEGKDTCEACSCSDLGTDGRAVCDEGQYCEKHYQEAAAEHAYLAHVPQSYVTGKYSDEERQDLIDAGRGHLLPPE